MAALGGRRAGVHAGRRVGRLDRRPRASARSSGYIAQGGFGAVKMRVGVFDGSPQASAERVVAARAALGPGIELMCDARHVHGEANDQFCHLVRDCNLAWFEEPGHGRRQARPRREVRRGTHIAIAAGERTQFDFRRLVDLRAADIRRPTLPSAVA